MGNFGGVSCDYIHKCNSYCGSFKTNMLHYSVKDYLKELCLHLLDSNTFLLAVHLFYNHLTYLSICANVALILGNICLGLLYRPYSLEALPRFDSHGHIFQPCDMHHHLCSLSSFCILSILSFPRRGCP